MSKCYLVQLSDGWNNNTFVGVLNSLDTATKHIKEKYDTELYKDLELKEYPSTFGMAFDTVIAEDEDSESFDGVYHEVRGYILDTEMLKPIDVKGNIIKS